jgi:hypothetical protein
MVPARTGFRGRFSTKRSLVAQTIAAAPWTLKTRREWSKGPTFNPVPTVRLVPVILTLVDSTDVEELARSIAISAGYFAGRASSILPSAEPFS